jgi:hypothetical protein
MALDGSDPGMWDAIVKSAAAAGPFGTLLSLFFWWRCDKERRDVTKAKDDAQVKHAAELARLVEGTSRVVYNNNTVLTGIERKIGNRSRQPAVRRRSQR